MIALDHGRNFCRVLENPHRRYFVFRLLPAFPLLEVHQDSLAGGVVVHNEDRASFHLDAGKDLMLLQFVIWRQRVLDLGDEVIRILDVDHRPWPLHCQALTHCCAERPE